MELVTHPTVTYPEHPKDNRIWEVGIQDYYRGPVTKAYFSDERQARAIKDRVEREGHYPWLIPITVDRSKRIIRPARSTAKRDDGIRVWALVD